MVAKNYTRKLKFFFLLEKSIPWQRKFQLRPQWNQFQIRITSFIVRYAKTKPFVNIMELSLVKAVKVSLRELSKKVKVLFANLRGLVRSTNYLGIIAKHVASKNASMLEWNMNWLEKEFILEEEVSKYFFRKYVNTQPMFFMMFLGRFPSRFWRSRKIMFRFGTKVMLYIRNKIQLQTLLHYWSQHFRRFFLQQKIQKSPLNCSSNTLLRLDSGWMNLRKSLNRKQTR